VSDEQNELFASVDALLDQAAAPEALPVPAERKRLREAAGLSQDQVAKALNVRRETVTGWEAGRTEPRPPARAAYIRLLDGLADRFPAFEPPSDSTPRPGSAPSVLAQPLPQKPAAGDEAAVRPPVTARRPVAQKAAAVRPGDARFAHGPLAVVDGDGAAYCADGLVLDCPLTDLPTLVDWALSEAKLGAGRLHRSGKDADPLIVLTNSAVQRLGLPAVLEDRRGLRLPDDHPVLKQLTKEQWKLTKRGFGPWARVYRTADGARRQRVQFAVVPWGALDTRSWGSAHQLQPAELARLLGTYATRLGPGLRRRGPRHRHPRPASAPLRSDRDQRPELPAQEPPPGHRARDRRGLATGDV